MSESILVRAAHEEVAENLTSLGKLALFWKNDPTPRELLERRQDPCHRVIDLRDVESTIE